MYPNTKHFNKTYLNKKHWNAKSLNATRSNRCLPIAQQAGFLIPTALFIVVALGLWQLRLRVWQARPIAWRLGEALVAQAFCR